MASAGIESLVETVRKKAKFKQLAMFSIQAITNAVKPPFRDWEINKQNWYNLRGRRIDAEKENGIIMRMLHQDIETKAIFDHMDDLHSDPERLKRWVKDKVRMAQTLGGGTLNLVDAPQGDDTEELQQSIVEELMNTGDEAT